MSALEQILFWASINYHPIYEQYLCEKYEEENGQHFNEEYAKKAVEEMYSYDGEDKVEGEHWTIEEVRSAISPYRTRMKEEDTCWDAYVALHVFWHDMRHHYKTILTNYEQRLIEGAITFFFEDDDAESGKIWRYIHCL